MNRRLVSVNPFHARHVRENCSPTWQMRWDQKDTRYVRTLGFHNFNLRIFNLRIPNPSKLTVYVFFDTMSDFNVPKLRPKKHFDISETD